MFVLTSENMKKAEEDAVSAGATFYALMDTAGTECAAFIEGENRKKRKNIKTVILCGKGKNGGDGLVIAERLWGHGFRNIFVILIGGEITEPLCVQMFERMGKYPINVVDMTTDRDTAMHHISTAEILVDAIFGIGFKGELHGNAADAVRGANNNNDALKYAIDIPSGLTADGNYDGRLYFRTDRTLTMIAYKPVHILNETRNLCGKTYVMKIGVKEEFIKPYAERYVSLTKEECKNLIKQRMPDDNKGTFGKILTVCGSRNMTGCVYLCNQAAVETGAGLVTAAFPDCLYPAVTPKLNEPLMLPLPFNESGRIHSAATDILSDTIHHASALAIGCGIGIDNDTKMLVRYIIKHAACPVVLDADALNCIADEPSVLKEASADILITPHPGEMARLTKKSIGEIQTDRMNTAAAFAKEYSVTVLLKGNGTVIADKNGRIAVNTTGNPGMARGGSGDVLTGMIAALTPQTTDLFNAAAIGAFIHGYVADELKETSGILSPTPSRIVENIHHFFI